MTARPSFLCGLIGAGIQGSSSPALHEEEGERLGLRLIYRRIDLDELKLGPEALSELLIAAERMGFAGLNITYPCKQLVIPLLDELSEEARAVGAVNTVVLKGGRRIGHNTDLAGYAAGFRRALPGAKLARVVLLGAGGAGAAVASAALRLGVKQLAIFDLDPSRSEELAGRLGCNALPGTDLAAAMASADGLIHCTPTGMDKHPGLPLPADFIQSSHWVSEIVYFPLETELLRVARAKGCRTADGSGMVVFQAADAFRLFTGLEPDAERMLRHFWSICAGTAT
ncbi:MAG: shikimate dehydrogenase [Burkholderiales bacterium]